MPRFVLLLHECPNDLPRPTHCDLMLESGDKLQTWALAELPLDWQSLKATAPSMPFAATNSCAAESLADHRLAYLDFEGPVSGDRGTVRQLDSGAFSNRRHPHIFELAGGLIRGQVEFHQTSGDNVWQLTFTPAPP